MHPSPLATALPPPRAWLCALALAAAVLDSSAGAAEKSNDGVIMQIPTTITTDSVARLRSSLHGPLKRFQESAGGTGQFIVLCDFNPDGRRSECDDFGACYGLATFLAGLSAEVKGAFPVAYVHADVRRHSVLPVLACKEVVFSPAGRLGQVVAPGRRLSRVERTAYEEIVRNRRPAEVVRKMFSPSDEFGQALALYDFAQASNLGLCQPRAADTLDEARTAYGLPRSRFRPMVDRSVAWRIPIEGTVTGETVEKTRRRVTRALRAGATVIVFELRCAGGDGNRAIELGRFLTGINDDRSGEPVETIAFVTASARNLAAFAALACNKIVMQRAPAEGAVEREDEDGVPPGEARLGDFGLYLRHDDKLAEILGDNLAEIAARQHYPAAVARALTRADLQVALVEPAAEAGGRMFLTKEEIDRDPKRWRVVRWVKPWDRQARYEGKPLTLTATQAQELDVASAVVKDFADLAQVEGLTAETVRVAEADWLDGLADFLRDPWTSMVLIMVAITCLILELKMPGVGLPGVVAAICFVLFFWAHSQLHGQITWLAILLFVLGLVLVGLEVFILPGFGVIGLSGVLLVLASLGLVAYGHWPRTGEEWLRFGNKLGPFGISLLGSLAAVFLVVRYLPHIPVLNRLLHRGASEASEEFDDPDALIHPDLQGLLGAIGVAATPLRPAGKTQFGDDFVDVVAEGGYVTPGTRVQVIEVEGNRVVVKEV